MYTVHILLQEWIIYITIMKKFLNQIILQSRLVTRDRHANECRRRKETDVDGNFK
jgi:hypothetical protein